jgi:hypothetical protein
MSTVGNRNAAQWFVSQWLADPPTDWTYGYCDSCERQVWLIEPTCPTCGEAVEV